MVWLDRAWWVYSRDRQWYTLSQNFPTLFDSDFSSHSGVAKHNRRCMQFADSASKFSCGLIFWNSKEWHVALYFGLDLIQNLCLDFYSDFWKDFLHLLFMIKRISISFSQIAEFIRDYMQQSIPSCCQQIWLRKLINMPFERVACRIHILHAIPIVLCNTAGKTIVKIF